MRVSDIILRPFQQIEDFIKPFLNIFSDVVDGVKAMKEGWVSLKDG